MPFNLAFPADGKFRKHYPRPEPGAASSPEPESTPSKPPAAPQAAQGPWGFPFQPATTVAAPQAMVAANPSQPVIIGMPYGQAAAPWPTVFVPLMPAAGGPPEKEGDKDKKEKKEEKKGKEKKTPVVLSVPSWKKGIDASNGEVCWVHSVTKKKTYRDPYV